MAAVMFCVQHLLGTGHLERARRIAEALAAAGHEVCFVTGGMPVPGRMPRAPAAGTLRLVQLPPIRVADASFAPLLDERGRPIDDAFRRGRVEALLAAFDAARPDALVVETFPFGRRALRFELVPLLERAAAAQPRPAVLASLRDILQARRTAGRDEETLEWARRWFDAVLVHADPRFVRLEASFPRAGELAVPVLYTGFVCAPRARVRGGPETVREEVVVSAGGGAVGHGLLAAALEAQTLSALRHAWWRLLVGEGASEAAFEALRARAGPGALVERARPDFAELLDGARVSVSQAGYNTVLDVARAGARAVLVPFEGRGETEQAMRARRLRELGLACVVPEAALTASRLAAAVDEAAGRARWGRWDFDVDGAARSAALIVELARARSVTA